MKPYLSSSENPIGRLFTIKALISGTSRGVGPDDDGLPSASVLNVKCFANLRLNEIIFVGFFKQIDRFIAGAM